ncbi:dihydrofolate reductase family protein [Thalassotalea atypica]|uniref:dihydrofolate reductase family protein n=1 Tax=Thalassotalea atypica TaxID=2054316 RepID=UPI0025729079|nr:dihydrofolate reductase family protein [Thalassotalea atypica]
MKYSVFIATSVDGFIAREDGSIDWLDNAGNKDADMGEHADMGFNAFIKSVDCMIMGRNTMEILSQFNLSPDQWPYGDLPIFVLSRTLKTLPENVTSKMTLWSGGIEDLIAKLNNENFQHGYIDGGQTIQSFIDLRLVNQLVLTRAPILLGKGIPLFTGNEETTQDIKLEHASAIAYPNNFVQERYKVRYD